MKNQEQRANIAFTVQAAKGKKCRFHEKISTEKGTKGIFSLKLLTWITIPLKVGIITTSKRLMIDWSGLLSGQKSIPFLTSCKLSETLVKFLLIYGIICLMEERKRKLTFLSYAHEDLDRVWKVYDGLKKRQVEVWFDKKDLGPGKWKPQIEKIITKCRYFIFCVSEASIKKTEEGTGFVEEELQTAWKIAEVQDEKKFTIVPIRFEECGHGDHRLSIFQQYDIFTDIEHGLDKLAINIGGVSLADAKARDERTEDEKLIESLLGKASISYYSGDYEKVFVLVESIIELDKENYKAWNLKGHALQRLRKYEEAIFAFDKSIKIKPDDNESWTGKGLVLFQSCKYKEAISAFNKAIAIKQSDYIAWLLKGNALRFLGQHKKAEKAFKKANQFLREHARKL